MDDPVRREVQERMLESAPELERLIKAKNQPEPEPEGFSEEAEPTTGEHPRAVPRKPAPAPAAPPAPAKAAKSAWAAIGDFAKRALGSASGPRRLNGKVRRQGRRLIIEIDLTGALQWSPPSTAMLHLSDGTALTVSVDGALTTSAGAYDIGLTVTLVLEVDPSIGETASVQLVSGAEALEIVL